MYQYRLRYDLLGSSSARNNLVVKVGSKLNKSQQHSPAAKQANSILGYLSKNVSSRSERAIHHRYSALVRPFLECSVQNFASSVQERC